MALAVKSIVAFPFILECSLMLHIYMFVTSSGSPVCMQESKDLGYFLMISQYISRQVGPKWSSWDLSGPPTPMGSWFCG